MRKKNIIQKRKHGKKSHFYDNYYCYYTQGNLPFLLLSLGSELVVKAWKASAPKGYVLQNIYNQITFERTQKSGNF